MFGIILVISFCDIHFINKHFLFLKTITGKGVFNLFLASMFLVGNGDSIWGYLMCAAFGGIGILFILIGCACIEGYDDSEIKTADLKNQARNSLTNNNKSTADNSTLLDENA